MQINTFKSDVQDTAMILSFVCIMESDEKISKGMVSLVDLYRMAKKNLIERGVIIEDETDEVL